MVARTPGSKQTIIENMCMQVNLKQSSYFSIQRFAAHSFGTLQSPNLLFPQLMLPLALSVSLLLLGTPRNAIPGAPCGYHRVRR